MVGRTARFRQDSLAVHAKNASAIRQSSSKERFLDEAVREQDEARGLQRTAIGSLYLFDRRVALHTLKNLGSLEVQPLTGKSQASFRSQCQSATDSWQQKS